VTKGDRVFALCCTLLRFEEFSKKARRAFIYDVSRVTVFDEKVAAHTGIEPVQRP